MKNLFVQINAEQDSIRKIQLLNKTSELLQQNLNDDYRDFNSWFYKGIVHQMLKQHKEALFCFEKVIENQKEASTPYLHKGISYYRLSSLENAISAFKKAYDKAEKQKLSEIGTKALYWQGRIHHTQNRLDSAKLYYQQTLERQPEHRVAKKYLNQVNPIEWYHSAEAAFQRKDWESAETYYRQVLSTDSTYKDAHQKLDSVLNIKKMASLDTVRQAKEMNTKEEKLPVKSAPNPKSERKDKPTEPKKVGQNSTVQKQPSDSTKTVSSNTPDNPDTSDSVETVIEFDSTKSDSQNNPPKTEVNSADNSVYWIFGILAFTALLLILLKRHFTSKVHIQATDVVKINHIIDYKWSKRDAALPADARNQPYHTPPRYQIERKIGSGGMAGVFKAKDVQLDRYVALKVIDIENVEDPKVIQKLNTRFIQEMKITAQLRHRNIVTLYDFNKLAGNDGHNSYYMIMEYIDGITLKELLKEVEQLRFADAIEIIKQICQALKYAHESGVIHRDLKPANIMLSQGIWVQLLDFGIAKALGDTDLTLTGERFGTPPYMSPEQLQFATVDNRTDIFSLGIILFEMLSGRRPDEIRFGKPLPKLNSFQPGLPKKMDAVIAKMLAKDPDERYQHIDEVINAFAALRTSKFFRS